MEARLITDRSIWNEFVASMPDGHICQTYEWPDHVGAGARADSLRVGVLEGERLVAAMVLVRSQATRVRAPFYYAPRGPVCRDPNSPALADLMAFARREAERRGAFMLRVEPNISEEAASGRQALQQLGFRRTGHSIYPRSSWITDLRPREEELLARMKKNCRYGIRAGIRQGVRVRHGSSQDDFEAFYRLLVETGARRRFYVYPQAVYRDMLAHYSPESAARHGTAHMALFLAEYEGIVVAAGTVAVLGRWAWYMHGASSILQEHRQLDPSRVLLWECMRWAKASGAEFYDWRSIPDVLKPGEELYGVYEFKCSFGGYSHRVGPTHDLVLRPAIYWPYMAVTSLRRRLHTWHRRASEAWRRRALGRPKGGVSGGEGGEHAAAGERTSRHRSPAAA